MSLIIGQDNFGETIQQKLNFIDKSLFIKEVFDNKNTVVSVIVRPRRFGKTFNMSMLHHFLAAEVNGLKTQNMFDNLKIAELGNFYMQEQGKHPVIFISFKSVKEKKFSDACELLRDLISETYHQHHYLLSSTELPDYKKQEFETVLNKKESSVALLKQSLYKLSGYLFEHHGVKPWILIDEYDTPIQAGYLNNYYPDIIEFMRGLFGSALKGNANMHRAIVTGILRIAKEDLFSDLNNIQVFSVLNSGYADHFGFTETEVNAVLKTEGLEHLSENIKTWYNGYHIGNSQIYNPWSIARCVNEKGSLQAYWIHTSDNALIKQTMAHADAALKIQFESILKGEPIEALVDENITFADLNRSGDKLWSLLVFAGYLTSTQTTLAGLQKKCFLAPPNKEVALLYPHIIATWFSESLGKNNYQDLLTSLTTGDLEDFLDILKKFLLESMSYFDVKGNAPEKFYHGFVMGLIVSLSDTYEVQSNKESGRGRYDVLLIPKDTSQLGLILEFKVAKRTADLQVSAENALEQINARGYAAELEQKQIKKILKIGLAFYGKEVAIASS